MRYLLAVMAAGLVGLGAAEAHAQSIEFDRDVYPIPFGQLYEFDDDSSSISVIPFFLSDDHFTNGYVDISKLTSDKIVAADELRTGGHTKVSITVKDPGLDQEQTLARNIFNDSKRGPITISVMRNGEQVILATAGSERGGGSIITLGSEPVDEQYDVGPLPWFSDPPGFGFIMFLRHGYGPPSDLCPITDEYDYLGKFGDGAADRVFKHSDGSTVTGNFCILNGDIIKAEYVTVAGETITDTATFTMHDGTIQTNTNKYAIGQDVILTLNDPDLNLDPDRLESYDLDLIGWDGGNDFQISLGNLGGHKSKFQANPTSLKETDKDTGVFQTTIKIPQELNGTLNAGDEFKLVYRDWSGSAGDFVGSTHSNKIANIRLISGDPTIELDYGTYTWTQKVGITVTSHLDNNDPNTKDFIGDASSSHQLTISTANETLDNYKLEETGPDTGIFGGFVTLTGFEYDANGDNTPDRTTGSASGSGPEGGSLPVKVGDNIVVSIKSSGTEIASDMAPIRWSDGLISWSDTELTTTGSGKIRVLDPDMNWNPNVEDKFHVNVSSTSDPAGILVELTESHVSTGVFEGQVTFAEAASSGTTLKVAAGDAVTTRYDDYTLDIRGSASIGDMKSITKVINIADAAPAESQIPSTTPPQSESGPGTNGKIEWTENGYGISETAMIKAEDADRNKDSTKADSLSVSVWSKTDLAGISLTLTETGLDTGKFEGSMSFTPDAKSSNTTLRVSPGDKITAEYEDKTPSTGSVAYFDDDASINQGESIVIPETIKIEFDKAKYSWTDKVLITITSFGHNKMDGREETIGVSSYPVKVATRLGVLDTYKFKEAGDDTGIFKGELELAGFAYNADGDSLTGSGGNDVTDVNPGGSGPANGKLPADNKDGLSVSFEYTNDTVAIASVPITWNKATATWTGSNLTDTGFGVFQVTDPDMNLDPDAKDSINAKIWSKGNTTRSSLVLKETGYKSGIFEGTMHFTIDGDGNSTTHVVKAKDTIIGTYMDHTLPDPHFPGDSLEIKTEKKLAPTAATSTDTTEKKTTNTTATKNATKTVEKPDEKKTETSKTTPAKTQTPAEKTTQKPDEQSTVTPDNTPDETPTPATPPPEPDPKPNTAPDPKPDPKPSATDPKPAATGELDPDLIECGPGTRLVGGTCQAGSSPLGLDVFDWLFTWFGNSVSSITSSI